MSEPQHPETKARLLHAAGECFAEKGYHRASLREICRLADLNVAMVKYYFGDKAGLYAAVLEHCHQCGPPRFVQEMGKTPPTPPEVRLRQFVRAMVARARGEDRPAWCGRILNRELVEPTEVRAEFVRREIAPVSSLLLALVQELAGPGLSRRETIRCALSIVGQCLHHRVAAGNIALLYPDYAYTAAELDALVEHITAFSLAGLAALRRARAASSRE
ncbi:CerR family C-terminal domain-containing protein [Megalodesulfovibrio gigas]|uniref:Putative TetR family transcriptional regulator n=1 Tax=Megalodesulfovibrio gigas (strain ATCC 19364 / DSM 1382 / NCIMB 9332 / VKM B-1759) TaxID=1121448 RepID=T2G8S1_MEGG1|nr:CerR family C-terminal domain-containing protein [Megalodesulfovibrio gigas]AGW12307.1 putative TetR family transcriptional regulator [Megalodesulfovibrio gigas DSM 1382 = ATCC 19364]